ncbi:MAG: hypothetical protein PHH65_05745 [Eubacteriales bacterium]|nr:hypothetical protein [Eubacteriales bacterium]MDD4025648.1 hypothetical protein [Kiritimatiellia bacterium]
MKPLILLPCCALIVASSGCEKAASTLINDRAERRRMETAERYARQESARLEREKKERLELEKQDTSKLLSMLPVLIKARRKLLRTKADELTDALQDIAADRRLADQAMASLEDRRGLEYTVYNVMTNTDLNALAVKYTGSDFSTLKLEFTESIRFHKVSYNKLTKELQKNADEYRKKVQNVDNEVDIANQNAQSSISATHANIIKRMDVLEREKTNIESRNRSNKNEQRLAVINEQLERFSQLLELSGGSSAHIRATVLESSARRKFDRALDEKETKDTVAISDSQFNGDIYNASQIYRGRSIDRLQNAMLSQIAVLSERLCSLESMLQSLEVSESRMQIMEYADLVKLRNLVISDTRDKLGSALTAEIGEM